VELKGRQIVVMARCVLILIVVIVAAHFSKPKINLIHEASFMKLTGGIAVSI